VPLLEAMIRDSQEQQKPPRHQLDGENGAQKKKGKTASSRSFTRELLYHN
jgi:hypothetical protein